MNTLVLVLCVVSVLIVLVVVLYLRLATLFYYAVMESYDTMSFEWQFEEEATERILCRPGGYVHQFLDIAVLRLLFSVQVNNRVVTANDYKNEMVRFVLLPILADEKLIESVTYRFEPDELRARWHHIEGLSPKHQERYIWFLKDKRFKEFKRVIEVTMVRKLPRGKKTPPRFSFQKPKFGFA